jgi:hypothetical protein
VLEIAFGTVVENAEDIGDDALRLVVVAQQDACTPEHAWRVGVVHGIEVVRARCHRWMVETATVGLPRSVFRVVTFVERSRNAFV